MAVDLLRIIANNLSKVISLLGVMYKNQFEMTPLDRRILKELTVDSRSSVTRMSGVLNVSRNTVRARLDALIASGVIRRFTIDVADIAQDTVRAITTIQLEGSLSRQVISALKALPEITALHSTNGAWDVVAEIEADDLVAIDTTLRQIREIPGVLNSETSLLLAPV
ncbi:MAG: Lrp/AsnC family transcriptional regulator [Pseudomonadota bacterium]